MIGNTGEGSAKGETEPGVPWVNEGRGVWYVEVATSSSAKRVFENVSSMNFKKAAGPKGDESGVTESPSTAATRGVWGMVGNIGLFWQSTAVSREFEKE